MGDLSNVRDAFVDALIGHYHQRIPYPNFPGGDAPGSASPGDDRQNEDNEGKDHE